MVDKNNLKMESIFTVSYGVAIQCELFSILSINIIDYFQQIHALRWIKTTSVDKGILHI